MPDRTLVASATNLLRRGFLVVPTDRKSKAGEPVNGLFAVARAIHRALAMRAPARAVAVVDTAAPNVGPTPWPEILVAQLPLLPDLLAALGLQVVVTPWRSRACRLSSSATLRSSSRARASSRSRG